MKVCVYVCACVAVYRKILTVKIQRTQRVHPHTARVHAVTANHVIQNIVLSCGLVSMNPGSSLPSRGPMRWITSGQIASLHAPVRHASVALHASRLQTGSVSAGRKRGHPAFGTLDKMLCGVNSDQGAR